MDFKEKAKMIKSYVPALFLAMKRKDTPLIAKILAGFTVGYALSPIDLIPDFVPVLGYLDDLIVLTVKLIPSEIIEECKVEAEGLWKDGKPKKWYYAIPIVIFYIQLIWWIVSKFIN